MALRGDSYGSVTEVLAFTRHLLDGQTNFNGTTRPTLTEVERMLDRASGALNLALSQRGFTTPVTNSTAKLTLSDWTVARATEYVELTQRGVGYSDAEGNRASYFKNLTKSADGLVTGFELGLKRLGAGVSHKRSAGLSFTGQDVQADRVDPDDTALAQPFASRGQFDGSYGEDDD